MNREVVFLQLKVLRALLVGCISALDALSMSIADVREVEPPAEPEIPIEQGGTPENQPCDHPQWLNAPRMGAPNARVCARCHFEDEGVTDGGDSAH